MGLEKRKKEKKDKKKKKRWIKIILILIVFAILVGGVSVVVNKVLFPTEKKAAVEVKVLDSLEDYGYALSDRDSKLYKEEYYNLKKILRAKEIDNEAYAKQVAIMFSIDLYTMSTKVNKYDIGGTEFFYKDKVSMFEKKVMDTIYDILIDNTYGDRKQNLPTVQSYEVKSVEETKYQLSEDSEEIDGYIVRLSWTYNENMGYDDEASIIVVREDNGKRWSVVEFQPDIEFDFDK